MPNPKGKKFTAAEKHFQKKELQYQKEIQKLKDYIHQNEIDHRKYQNTVRELTAQVAELTEWVDRLLTYTELSREEIKTACAKDRLLVDFCKTLGMFNNII